MQNFQDNPFALPVRRYGDSRTAIALTVFAALFLLRIGMLAAHGPIVQPDSAGYEGYAALLLSAKKGALDAHLRSEVAPITVFRTIGYPALIAFAQLIAGHDFGQFLVLVQSAVSVAAAYLLYRTALAFGLSWVWALICAILYSSSLSLLFDVNILTDSLNASLFLSVAAAIACGILTRRVRFSLVFLAGLAFAVEFLIRGETVYFLPPMVAGILLWGRAGKLSRSRMVLAILMFIAPVLCAWQGYRIWNQHRTGMAFVSTAGQFATLMPVVDAMHRGALPSAPGATFARAYHAIPQSEPFPEAVAIDQYLFWHDRMTAPQLLQFGFHTYFQAFVQAPFAMLYYMIRNCQPSQAFLLVNFTHAPHEIARLARVPQQALPHFTLFQKVRNLSKHFSLPEALGLLFDGLSRLASSVLFLAFMIGVPWSIVRRWWHPAPIGSRLLVLGWFWLLYNSLLGFYCLVHGDPRYLLPVLGLAILGGIGVFTLEREGNDAYRLVRAGPDPWVPED